MRRWKLIRQDVASAGNSLSFEVDGLLEFAALFVTYIATGADSSNLILAPSQDAGRGTGNLPGAPAAPTAVIGTVYTSIGPGLLCNVPLPNVLRFGLTANAAAGSSVTIRVEGQYDSSELLGHRIRA